MSGVVPGEVLPGPVAPEELPDDAVIIVIRNTGDRPVQVASHYHLFEANAALEFDRRAAYGRRLALPAGAALRFEPGEQRSVAALRFRGERVVRGFLGCVDGPLDAEGATDRALAELRRHGVDAR